jgi:hypothetical protein
MEANVPCFKTVGRLFAGECKGWKRNLQHKNQWPRKCHDSALRHMLLEFRAAKHYNPLLWRSIESFPGITSVKQFVKSFPTFASRLPLLG